MFDSSLRHQVSKGICYEKDSEVFLFAFDVRADVRRFRESSPSTSGEEPSGRRLSRARTTACPGFGPVGLVSGVHSHERHRLQSVDSQTATSGKFTGLTMPGAAWPDTGCHGCNYYLPGSTSLETTVSCLPISQAQATALRALHGSTRRTATCAESRFLRARPSSS